MNFVQKPVLLASFVINAILVVLLTLTSRSIPVISGKNIRTQIRPYPKSFFVDNESGDVIVAGTWVAADASEGNDFAKDQVNTADIFCDAVKKKCHEERALLVRFKNDDAYDLFAYRFEYDVQEWNENYISAKIVGSGRVFDLTINIHNQTALLAVSDNQNNPTASSYVHTATLENGSDVWGKLMELNNK